MGATLPSGFLVPGPEGPAPEAVAYFSARGGEVAKPDLVTPGMAYSSVPRWNAGDEVKQGTSMASPHAAGLVACMVSALVQEKRPVDAARIKRALMVTARPTPGAEYLDEGRGLPALDAAWTWLASAPGGGEVTVAAAGGGDAGWRVLGPGVARSGTMRFAVSPSDSAPAGPLRLESDVAWLTPPARVSLKGGGEVTLRYDAAKLPPGVHTGTVLAWSADTLRGPAFRLVATLVLPEPANAGPTALRQGAPQSRARSCAPSSWPIRRGRSSPASRPTASPAAPSPSCTSRTERHTGKRPRSRPAARPRPRSTTWTAATSWPARTRWTPSPCRDGARRWM